MSNTPNYDAKIKTILDEVKPGERVCAITGEKWMMGEEEINWYKKFNVPPSTHSPLTRMRLLVGHWPAGQWWWHKHAETGKPIITGIHPASGMKVLPDKEWFAKDFETVFQDYQSSVPFIDQLYQLRRTIPVSASQNYEEAENSICFNSWGDQNSYFVTGSKTKDTLFAAGSFNVESSAEICLSQSVTSSFHVVHSERIHQSRFIFESRDCLNSSFLFDCRNCEFCFGATNKRNKKYLFFNEQLTESDWKACMAEINLGSRRSLQKLKNRFDGLMQSAVWPENFNEKADKSVGEYLTNCLDCRYVFYGLNGAQHNFWGAFNIGKSEGNAFTADAVDGSENYCASGSTCRRCFFSVALSRCQSCEFSMECYDCENCFGCVGLRHKKFCILNKQYDEVTYWTLVDQIKTQMMKQGEYGQPIPAKFAPVYFPESAASKLYLADDQFGQQAQAQMFDPESEGAIGQELMAAKEVKEISELPDEAKDLTGWASVPLYDPVFKRRFSLLAPEVALYQELNIAPPSEHFIVRVRKLFNAMNSGVFVEDHCAVCQKSITIGKNATYPERKLYCREDYLKFIESNG